MPPLPAIAHMRAYGPGLWVVLTTVLGPYPCRGGGGEGFCQGRISLFRKVAKVSPGVTVPSFTTAAGIVFLEKGPARLRTEAAQETVGPGAFVGALRSCWKPQFWDHVVAMCCNFGLSGLVHVLLFCCSHLGVRHLELWRFQGWQNYPLAKLSPGEIGVGKPSMDSECASGCTWSTARATARIRDCRPLE